MPVHDLHENPNILELELPEIEGRDPYTPPTSHLEKTGPESWEEKPGRRVSNALLVNKLRDTVDVWRDAGYPGASETSKRLLQYWFDEDHLLASGEPFRFYFCQQEAVETILYLYEVEGRRDAAGLVQAYFQSPTLFELEILTSTKGVRTFRRYIPEIGKEAEQELPPEGLSRYAVKMATGSGKTVVMALVIAWSWFHRRFEPGSDLAANFLVVAPNVIVYERLREDFDSRTVFNNLPIVPPEWKADFSRLQTFMRGDSRDPSASGNLFLTNIQQIYEDNGGPAAPINPIAALLGNAPKGNLNAGQSMLDRIKKLNNLMVLNDEAHHVHDEDLAWNKTLAALHENLKTKSQAGLTLWLDFSATPKNQNGTYFPWIVVDYPLAQAVEDRIVKTPLIIHQTDKVDPDKYAHEEAGDAYNEWIAIAVERWRQHVRDYAVVGEKPLLFVMAEDTKDADSIAERLRREPEFKDKDRVLLIHTKKNGEITEKDLAAARDAARTVDKGTSRTRAIVSVLMLREGWDVRNVSVILGLRPFTAKANILPEQAIGRGLRLMRRMPRSCNQILELIGTNAFELFIRELEKEGVGIPRITKPKPPVQVFPLEERRNLDIRIPRTTPLYEREYRRLEELDPLTLPQLAKEKDLDKEIVNRIDLVHGIVNIKVASDEIEFNAENVPPIENLLSSLTNRVEKKAKLTGRFAELYPKVREYVQKRCFGGTVELDDVGLRRALNHSGLLDAIAGMFGRKIGELTATIQPVKLTGNDYLLSETEPFLWRRMISHADRTIFNVVPCYNDLEVGFASFLNSCDDIDRFAALAEWFTKFHVQYLSLTGSIRLYYPDFVAVQTTQNGDVHWILETKGREFEETTSKDFHIARGCEDVSRESGESWRYLKVLQPVFEDFIRRGDYRRFEALVEWNSIWHTGAHEDNPLFKALNTKTESEKIYFVAGRIDVSSTDPKLKRSKKAKQGLNNQVIEGKEVLLALELVDPYSKEEYPKSDVRPHINLEPFNRSDIANVDEGSFIRIIDNKRVESADDDPIAREQVERNDYLLRSLRSLEASNSSHPDAHDKDCPPLQAVTFHVNVGHGNCTFIVLERDSNSEVWLVDCSNYDFTDKDVSNRYYNINIDKCIDYIKQRFSINNFKISKFFLTHTHYDHYSGLQRLAKKGYLDKAELWINLQYTWPSPSYNKLLNVLKECDVKFVEPKSENSTHEIIIWHPEKTVTRLQSDPAVENSISIKHPNHASVVYEFRFNEVSIVFPGDMESERWNAINACHPHLKGAQYYCISHHGSINGHIRSCESRGGETIRMSDCSEIPLAILMGRDKAYPGIYSPDVIKSFKGRLVLSEKKTKDEKAAFLEIDLYRRRHTHHII